VRRYGCSASSQAHRRTVVLSKNSRSKLLESTAWRRSYTVGSPGRREGNSIPQAGSRHSLRPDISDPSVFFDACTTAAPPRRPPGLWRLNSRCSCGRTPGSIASSEQLEDISLNVVHASKPALEDCLASLLPSFVSSFFSA